jgi:hypothetical protein
VGLERIPDRLAFELHAILLGADTTFVLYDDPRVMDLARRCGQGPVGVPHLR